MPMIDVPYSIAPAPPNAQRSKRFAHRRRVLTPTEFKWVMDAYHAGHSWGFIYQSTGIAPHIARRHLVENGVTMPVYAYSRIKQSDVDLIVQLRTAGLSMRKIGARVGISHHAVKRCLVTNQLVPLSRSEVGKTRLSAYEINEMCRLYQSGMTLTELYTRFHIHRTRAIQILTEQGLVIRKPRDYARDKDRLNHNPSRGYSGYYKKWWFRSRDELSYALMLDKTGHQWIGAEQKQFQIPYRALNGRARMYYPDFLVDGKYLVEVKPSRFWNDPDVKRKAGAARKFCRINGLVYRLVNHPYRLDIIRSAYQAGLIQFTVRDNRYFKKFISQLHEVSNP